MNDGKLFDVTKPNRRFCSQSCKDEYHRHGSAFGPLKERLEKLVASLAEEKFKPLQSEIKKLDERLQAIENRQIEYA